MPKDSTRPAPSREKIIHALYEAAEIEHCLMCSYLYAAFSLRTGSDEGLAGPEAEAVASWRRTILGVAVDEMSHLIAVWNLTSSLGGAPRFGRANFPLDPGYLPAKLTVRLAPFDEAVIQHFIYHMMQSASRVTGSVLWANCTLLFWLTLIPLVIRWVDQAGITSWPVACSAVVLTFCTISYLWLERALMGAEGSISRVRYALGSRMKEWISFTFLLVAIPVSFFSPYLSVATLVTVSIGWLIPDRRFERMV